MVVQVRQQQLQESFDVSLADFRIVQPSARFLTRYFTVRSKSVYREAFFSLIFLLALFLCYSILWRLVNIILIILNGNNGGIL